MPKFMKNDAITLLDGGIEAYLLALYGISIPLIRLHRKQETKYAPVMGLLGASVELLIKACLVQAKGKQSMYQDGDISKGIYRFGSEVLDELRKEIRDATASISFLWKNLDDFYEQAFWIQKDVLAEAGYPNPSTLEEYFEVIEAYYEKYPTIDGMTTLPFEIFTNDNLQFSISNPPPHMIGAGNDGNFYVDQETYIAELYQTQWYAKDYYQFMNGKFKQGLISPETFTQNLDQYKQKIAAGRVLGMFDALWRVQDAENVLFAEQRYERTYVPLGITYEGYTQGYMDDPSTSFVGGNGLGISVNCKDPDRVLEYIDILLNEDVQRLLAWGINGEDYYIDSNGRYLLTEEQRANWDNPDWRDEYSGWRLRDQFPKIQGMYSDGNAHAYSSQPEIRALAASDYDQKFFENYEWSLRHGFLQPTEKAAYYPIWGMTMPRGSDAREGLAELEDLQRRYLPDVIMADDFETTWAEYIQRYDGIRWEAYLEEVNSQIKKRMGM